MLAFDLDDAGLARRHLVGKIPRNAVILLAKLPRRRLVGNAAIL